MRTNVLPKLREGGILGAGMSEEPEDHNEFGKWDSVGAAAMVGIGPAVLYYVASDHDIYGTLSWASIAGIAAGVVYLLSFIVPQKKLSRMVNLCAWITTIIYSVVAFIVWRDILEKDFPSADETKKVENQQTPQQG